MSNGNVVEVFVPGRLCILGEHSDWAAGYRVQEHDIEKGYALVAGLNLGIYLRGYENEGFSYEFQDKKINISREKLLSWTSKNFFEYVISSAKVIHSKYNVPGARIICDKMTLPMKKGLASSAAICVAVIRIYNLLYDLKLSVEDEMTLAYEAETSTGSMCGKMDQVCAYGQGIRKVVFDADKIETFPLSISNELQFILVDLGGEKDTKRILADLNCEFTEEINTGKHKLITAIGESNKYYVEDACRYLISGNTEEFGRVLNNFQNSFDGNVACFSEKLKSPRLHRLMDYCSNIDGIVACKGVGSQGDGMAQILLDDHHSISKITKDIKNKLGMDCYLYRVGQIGLNAIIPIAGKGTRMYPYTKIIDKSMLPIIFSGKVYPALYLIIRELYYSSQLEKINLIVNESQYKIINKLDNLLRFEGMSIRLVCTEQIGKGFGGAISSSECLYEPGFSMVCLGDYVYKSRKIGDCTKQLVDFWKKNNKSVVCIKSILTTETEKFGVVFGDWITDNVIRISKIVEKPDPKYARQNLMMEHNGEKCVFAFFGQYIIDNDILRRMSMSGDEEIGFSEFLNEYAQRQDVYALIIDGESFDLGNPKDYYFSFIEYGKE